MITYETITVAQAVDRYDLAANGSCIDGLYEIRGGRAPIRHAIGHFEADANVTIDVTSGLIGWSDYSDFLTVRTGAGNFSLFARRK